MTSGSLLYLDSTRFANLVQREAEVGRALAQELTDALNRTLLALEAHVFGDVRSRLAREILERSAAMATGDEEGRVYVTRQELADSIGSAREVVSRAIKSLTAVAVLECFQGGVRVLDSDQLAAVAGAVR